MKRITSIIISGMCLLAVATTLSAQQQQPATVDSVTTAVDYLPEVYQKENIPFKAPIPFAYVREADVLYEKTVWRMINLTEKQNMSLFFPTAAIGGRMNLINLLVKGIESGEIIPYDPNDEYNEFARKITLGEIDSNLGAKRDTIDVEDENGNLIRQARDIARQTAEVKKIIIKEKIYFDKRRSVLERRVIGICPIRVFAREGAEEGAGLEMTKVMWIYMPEARGILSRHPIFNTFNDAQNVSFDDFFMQNRYAGHIFRISNVYNNRNIDEYASGLDALYEAQRIGDEIFDFEQSLWEY